MVNVVTAGRFEGKKIKAGTETAFIPIKRERLDITHEIVDHIRLMDVVQEKSFFSGLLRGCFAKWLGNTAWLSAIQSAHSKCKYRIRIAYRDGTASVCIVDSQILDQLAVTCNYY